LFSQIKIHSRIWFKTPLDCFCLSKVFDLCISLPLFRQDDFFHWKKSWWICFMKTCIFPLYKMLTDGLECCGLLLCFLSAVWTPLWWHPFTSENQLVSKWCNATFLQIWWRKTLLCLGWPEGEYIFIKFSFLGEPFL